MSEPPEYEDAVITFTDKPPLLTMMSGGLFMSIFLYFIFQRVTRDLTFPGSQFLPLGVAMVIILLSVIRSRQIDVTISINTKSGWIHGSNRTQFWEGYVHEAKSIIVLQRERSMNEETNYIEYKLLLELEDESTYEIPLITNQAEKAIEAIEKAKVAIPLKPDHPSKKL